MKEKIDKKANKIISFGQTPFKLLEDKHPQWVESTKNININNNVIECSYLFTIPQTIIFIYTAKNGTKKNVGVFMINPLHN